MHTRSTRHLTATFALGLGAGGIWRIGFLEREAQAGLIGKLQAMAPALGVDALIIGALLALVLGGRLLAERTSLRAPAWGAVLVALTGLGWLYFVRIFDGVYFYYSSNHIDAMLVNHAQGSALGMRPNAEMFRYIGVGAGIGVAQAWVLLLFARHAARMRATSEMRAALLRVGATAVAVAVCLWGLWLALPQRIADRDARLATASPEFSVIPLLFASAELEADGTSSELDPVIVRKLERFGISVDPDAEYPLVHPRVFEQPFPYPKKPGATERPNVMLLFFESFSAALTSVYDDSAFPDLTPNLRAFARESHVVSGFHNASIPTMAGIICTLCSHYPTTEMLEWQKTMRSNFRCLPTILAKHGYDTTYMHQVENSYINTGAIMRRAGFSRVIGRDEVAEMFQEQPKSWGFSDQQMFRVMSRWIERGDFEQPFLLSMKTLDSHAPFNHSPDTLPYRDGASPLLNTVYTADIAFGRFWDEFKSSRFADDTIVVVVADHAMVPGMEYRRLREPTDVFKRFFDENLCLIHDPTRDMVGRSQILSSQVDIAPTILHMLGINEPNHFEGLSIFEARLEFPAMIGMSKEFFYIDQPNGNGRSVLRTSFDELARNQDLFAPDPSSPLLSPGEYFLYFRWKQSLLQQNRIWPEDVAAEIASRKATAREQRLRPVDTLIDELGREPDVDRRTEIVDQLGRHGPAAIPATSVLSDVLRDDENERLRAAAARALGRIGLRVTATLRAALLDPSPFVRREAVLALGRCGHRDGLEALLGDAASAVRLAALAVMHDVEIGAPSGLASLRELAGSASAATRRVSFEAMAEVEGLGASDRELLVAALEDPDIGARAAAAATIGGAFAADDFERVAPLLSDDRVWVRQSALYAIAVGKQKAVALWSRVAALAADPEASVRAIVPHALIMIDPRGAFCTAALCGLLEDPTAMVRNSTARAMGEALALRGPQMAPAVPLLIALLDEPAARVDALKALRNLDSLAAPAVGAIRPLLDDADVKTCLQAIETILRIGPEAMPAVPQLIALLSSSMAEVRLRTVDAIGSVAPADPRCVRALENQRRDPDERVRIRALEVLRRND